LDYLQTKASWWRFFSSIRVLRKLSGGKDVLLDPFWKSVAKLSTRYVLAFGEAGFCKEFETFYAPASKTALWHEVGKTVIEPKTRKRAELKMPGWVFLEAIVDSRLRTSVEENFQRLLLRTE
jgi:hypothetical protein